MRNTDGYVFVDNKNSDNSDYWQCGSILCNVVALEVMVNELLEKCQGLTASAVDAQKAATDALKQHTQHLKAAMDKTKVNCFHFYFCSTFNRDFVNYLIFGYF